MELDFTPFTLHFKTPFAISSGVRSSTDTIIVKITSGNIIAYGEASLPPYLEEDVYSVSQFILKAKKYLKNIHDITLLPEIIASLDQLAPKHHAAKSAIDIALHDLFGKVNQAPLYKMWGLEFKDCPPPFFTIGVSIKEDELKSKIEAAKKFKLLKVKVDGENDRRIISSIRKMTDKAIVIDANQGWKDKQQALDLLHWMKEQNVLFVEQPFQKNNMSDQVWIKEQSPLPLFADESLQRLSDLDIVKNHFHGINIKLTKCTGLLEAKKIIAEARKENLQIMIGCMSESSCAISAAAHLAPLCDYADLDGAFLIKNDPFEGTHIEKGIIEIKNTPGIGVSPKVKMFGA